MKRCCYVILAAMALRGQVPSDAEIRAILSDRIDKLHQNVGIAVGIIDANGRRFVSYGNFSVKDPRPVGSDTVFEIGSTTKVFTSTILWICRWCSEYARAVGADSPVPHCRTYRKGRTTAGPPTDGRNRFESGKLRPGAARSSPSHMRPVVYTERSA